MRGIAGSIVVRAVIVLFSVFCIFSIIKLQFEKNDLQDQLDEQSAHLEAEQQVLDELEREVDEELDEEYVKKIAKEDLEYRDPSEIVFYSGD